MGVGIDDGNVHEGLEVFPWIRLLILDSSKSENSGLILRVINFEVVQPII